MKTIRSLILMTVALASGPAYAQYTDSVVKIGVLTDMSSLYADNTGPGSVAAAKLAVADFGAEAKGIKVEIRTSPIWAPASQTAGSTKTKLT